MRLLIIGALLATLIGCCRTPPQASLERCMSKGCFHRTASNPRVELKPVSFRPGPAAANVKLTTTAKAPEPPSPQPTDHTGLIEKSANSTISSTPEALPPDRLTEISDTVLKNAKTTLAAKMENPASVEFREMKRAEGRMRSVSLSTPFAATSGEEPLQAKRPETSRFYILSKKTRRTSALTL